MYAFRWQTLHYVLWKVFNLYIMLQQNDISFCVFITDFSNGAHKMSSREQTADSPVINFDNNFFVIQGSVLKSQ